MTRLLAGAALAACVIGTLGAARPEQPVSYAAEDLVRIFATVTDPDGRLVTTLTRDAFDVRDDGERQTLTRFDNTPQPLRLIVMLDVSSSMSGSLPFLRVAAAHLFARLRPDDFTRVGTFGHQIAVNAWFTHHPETLRASVPATIAPDAPSPLWRAIAEALDGFGAAREEARSVILVVTDGMDTDRLELDERPASQSKIIDRARRDDVMIYAIGMRHLSSPPATPIIGPTLAPPMLADLPDPGLARVAEETGGGYTEVRVGPGLRDAFVAVADELHGQYLLGFVPGKRDGMVHDIDVRVSQAGVKTRARKSYLAQTG